MILHLPQVIDAATLDAIRDGAARCQFVTGETSAGWAARTVKRNEQAQRDRHTETLLDMVERHLREHTLFALAARPKAFPRLMISRYREGMAYGSHVDDCLIAGQRTDLSFTLGLTSEADYQGGELVLEDSSGERAWKLGAGDLLLYPTVYLHRVEPVVSGERIAVVGWVRSLVRDAQQRALLFELELALREEFSERGKSQQFDRLSLVRTNLMRLWLED
ncbi:Fe2+-dependent dioxygenase [Haliea atlantica]|nr:Fe2+-dependent dioxygenase [Haliea sp.]MAL94014.1 Fe2+-dependent dioxygenase [Haliea sp.]|tara:strand:+ start:303 stop:962 length:660 start_codon:yes stop_codon:yes gene_type:complete